MKEVKVTTKLLVEKCPYCKKKITGTKKSQVEYNLKIHIDAKHKGVEKKDDKIPDS